MPDYTVRIDLSGSPSGVAFDEELEYSVGIGPGYEGAIRGARGAYPIDSFAADTRPDWDDIVLLGDFQVIVDQRRDGNDLSFEDYLPSLRSMCRTATIRTYSSIWLISVAVR